MLFARFTEHRAERDAAALAAAVADGPTALAGLAVHARGSGYDVLEERAQAELQRIINGPRLGELGLDDLQAWFDAATTAHLPGETSQRVADAYGRRFVGEAAEMDLEALSAREIEAWQIDAPRDGTYARFDELFAAHVAANSLGVAIDNLAEVHLVVADLPKTAAAMAKLAASLIQSANDTIDDVVLAEPYLAMPPDQDQAAALIHAAYQRAYEHELRAATLETISELLDRASAHDVGDEAQVKARADALFVAAVAAAVDRDGLDSATNAAPSLLDVDHTSDVVKARGKLLARRPMSLDERAGWVGWLGDDPLALQLYRGIVASGMAGDLTTTNAALHALWGLSPSNGDVAATFEDDHTKVRERLEAMCKRAFPDASLGDDLARHLAAHECSKPSPQGQAVVGYTNLSDDADVTDIATTYARRTAAILAAAGGPRELGISDDGGDITFSGNDIVMLSDGNDESPVRVHAVQGGRELRAGETVIRDGALLRARADDLLARAGRDPAEVGARRGACEALLRLAIVDANADASELLQRATELDPYRGEPWLLLARRDLDAGNRALAEQRLEKLAALLLPDDSPRRRAARRAAARARDVASRSPALGDRAVA